MRGLVITTLLLLAAGCSSVGSEPGDGSAEGRSTRPVPPSRPPTAATAAPATRRGKSPALFSAAWGTAGPRAVPYDGATYPVGARFGACNNCWCGADGNVACTFSACPLDGGLPPFDGGAPGCTYNGVTYTQGSSFPSSDGCNSCGCEAGVVSCTERACDDVCTLDATYTFGGERRSRRLCRHRDADAAGIVQVRIPAGNPTTPAASCMPAMPACRTDGAIDIANITADLSDADVQRSFGLAQPLVTVPTAVRSTARCSNQALDRRHHLRRRRLPGHFVVVHTDPGRRRQAGRQSARADEQQLADPSCAAFQR